MKKKVRGVLAGLSIILFISTFWSCAQPKPTIKVFSSMYEYVSTLNRIVKEAKEVIEVIDKQKLTYKFMGTNESPLFRLVVTSKLEQDEYDLQHKILLDIVSSDNGNPADKKIVIKMETAHRLFRAWIRSNLFKRKDDIKKDLQKHIDLEKTMNEYFSFIEPNSSDKRINFERYLSGLVKEFRRDVNLYK